MTEEEILFFRDVTNKLAEIIDKEVSANKGVDTMKYKGKSISRRPDGRWWARYCIDGKQKSVYGKTQAECLTKLKKALAEKPQEKTSYNLEEWSKQWIKLYKINKVKDSTLHSLTLLLNKYLYTNDICKVKINKLKPMELQSFLNGITYSRQREHLFVHLKDMLDKAEQNSLIKNNPMKLVTITKHQKTPRRTLTKEEQIKLIQACKNNPYGNFYLILLYTGLRRGELLALNKSDVNFENKTIMIDKTLNDLGTITSTKNSKPRIIPILDVTIEPLKQAIKDSKFERIFNITENPVTNNFVKIRKEMQAKDITMHSLRHTFATNCLEAGIPAKQVQTWLGHSSIDITLDNYSHIRANFEQKNAEKIDTYFDTNFDTNFDTKKN